ncbi:MAG TPA: DUF3604 domain-containing protein, partial [Candidatus Acidoferrum sp.]
MRLRPAVGLILMSLLAVVSTGMLVSRSKAQTAQTARTEPEGSPNSAQTPPQPNSDREAYFGETHVHTSWSLDAWLGGDR